MRGAKITIRFAAAERAVSLSAPRGAMAHPPDAPGPGDGDVVAPGGEVTNAWVSPDAVVPAPATCPRSLTASASVAVQPGKERTWYVPPDRRKLPLPSP